MRVAVIQLAPRITNPDDRFALEDVPVESFRPQPRPPRKSVILRALKPRTAPLVLHRLIVTLIVTPVFQPRRVSAGSSQPRRVSAGAFQRIARPPPLA